MSEYLLKFNYGHSGIKLGSGASRVVIADDVVKAFEKLKERLLEEDSFKYEMVFLEDAKKL